MRTRAESITAKLDVALIVSAWALLFFVAPHDIDSDATYRHTALVELITKSHISSIKWPLIGTYLSAPLYYLGNHVQTPDWWVSRYNVILLGVGALALWRILGRELPARVVRVFVLLLLTSAMLPHESTESGAEPFNAIGVAVGLAAWGTRRYALGTALTALGVANMPASIVGLAFALLSDFLRDRRLRVALPLLLAAALCLGENWLRKGGPFNTGYDHEKGFKTFLPYSGLPDFSYPFFLGVWSLLFSAGKGILFFAPGLFLSWRNERRALSPAARNIFVMWALFVVGLFAVYSRWWSWYGGYAWGPRFFIFASIPASLVLAVRLRAAKAPHTSWVDGLTLVALLVSIWVGATGITFRMLGQPFCQGDNYAHESYCWYIPEFSVLATPFVNHGNTNADMRLLLSFWAFVAIYLGAPLAFKLAQHGARNFDPVIVALNPKNWRL